MTPTQWQRVKQVFTAVSDSTGGDRAALLAQLCGDDRGVRTEVEALLAADGQAAQFMHTASSGSLSSVARMSDGLVGRKIGGYTLLRVLGHGGMGTVYEAEQAEPRRRVALKIVRGGRFVDEHVARLFRREVQALALLNHPHIAALYESGRTAEGEHYFVMELVEGVPLNEYFRRKVEKSKSRKIETDEVLDLFVQICEGIAYAHQRGVIHRDLKPNNILVAGVGAVSDRDIRSSTGPSRSETAPTAQPKILDFGLAKITESDLALTTLTKDVGKIQGTLAYMSPEQAAGRSADIDLRSDIYSLGVVLYELLTDQLPYGVRSSPLPHAVRLICDQPPQRPSTINRVLRGDLDTILLKALEKDPARRYPTVAALVDDIQRFRDGQPILARRQSAAYQLTKLVQRHRAATAALAILFFFITGFSVTVAVLYGQSQANLSRATKAEEEARIEGTLARKSADSLLEMFLTGSPRTAEEAKQILYAKPITPSVKASFMEVAERERLEIVARWREDGPSGNIGVRLCNIGFVFVGLFEFEAAIKVLQQSREVLQGVPGITGRSAPLRAMGPCYLTLGRPAEAEAVMREAIELAQQDFGDESYDAIEARQLLYIILSRTGKLEEAEAGFRSVLEWKARTLGSRHWELGYPLRGLGNVLIMRGQPAAAEPFLRDAMARFEGIFGEDNAVSAVSKSYLGWCLTELGRYEEAEELLVRAPEVSTLLTPAGQPRATELLRLRVRLYELWGKPDQAAEWRPKLAAAQAATAAAD